MPYFRCGLLESRNKVFNRSVYLILKYAWSRSWSLLKYRAQIVVRHRNSELHLASPQFSWVSNHTSNFHRILWKFLFQNRSVSGLVYRKASKRTWEVPHCLISSRIFFVSLRLLYNHEAGWEALSCYCYGNINACCMNKMFYSESHSLNRFWLLLLCVL